MNDEELLNSRKKCWACIAGLTSLTGDPDQQDGFVKCDCPKKLHFKPRPKTEKQIKELAFIEKTLKDLEKRKKTKCPHCLNFTYDNKNICIKCKKDKSTK